MPYKDPEKRKEAQRRYSRKWYTYNKARQIEANNRQRDKMVEWFQEYKSGLQCSKCPKNHPACLEFHHRKSDDKYEEIANMVRNRRSKKAILAEIDKCDVLCSNCHRKLHYELLRD